MTLIFRDHRIVADSKALEAVLIKPQLDRLCEAFGLTPGELETDFTGWSKHVIKSRDRAFLFPRHPRYQRSLDLELAVYELLNGLNGLPVPRLVESVENREMSPYRFGVVTRLQGVLLGRIEHACSTTDYGNVICAVGRLAGVWHNLPLGPETDFLKPQSHDVDGDHGDSYRWLYGALESGTLGSAPDSVASSIRELAAEGSTEEFGALNSAASYEKWQRAFGALAAMEDVVLHGDIHEDQILVRSDVDLEVTGILDWGNAGIGNPVLEFNFGEWGGELWRYRSDFSAFREAFWGEYLRTRGLDGPSWESVHLLYTVQELIWTMNARKAIGNGGPSFGTEVRRLLRSLNETTAAL